MWRYRLILSLILVWGLTSCTAAPVGGHDHTAPAKDNVPKTIEMEVAPPPSLDPFNDHASSIAGKMISPFIENRH